MIYEYGDTADDGAAFSDDKLYRYHLWRRVREGSGTRCLFLMLNPSTADAKINDPTIRRCIGYARSFGHSFLDVCNIFAWRSTNPKVLAKVADPVGPENDAEIIRIASQADTIVAAWGKHGRLYGRGNAVLQMVRDRCATEVGALWVNKDGSPSHPLFLDSYLVPRPYLGA